MTGVANGRQGVGAPAVPRPALAPTGTGLGAALSCPPPPLQLLAWGLGLWALMLSLWPSLTVVALMGMVAATYLG
jgi:hypothetical protein